MENKIVFMLNRFVQYECLCVAPKLSLNVRFSNNLSISKDRFNYV